LGCEALEALEIPPSVGMACLASFLEKQALDGCGKLTRVILKGRRSEPSFAAERPDGCKFEFAW
jgi:hypothetical protein